VKSWEGKRVGIHSIGDHTAIELIGRDRPGLLSEISAVLASFQFNVIAAEVWTHNRRIACVLYVNDATNQAVDDDSKRLSLLDEKLNHILRGCEDDENVARTSFSMGFTFTHMDRRLHQMLFADRDYESAGGVTTATNVDSPPSFRPNIEIERIEEKGYSVVSVRCKDRAKLMFDIVCTLTDMEYVVFHASISSDGPYASQVCIHYLLTTTFHLVLQSPIQNFENKQNKMALMQLKQKRRLESMFENHTNPNALILEHILYLLLKQIKSMFIFIFFNFIATLV